MRVNNEGEPTLRKTGSILEPQTMDIFKIENEIVRAFGNGREIGMTSPKDTFPLSVNV